MTRPLDQYYSNLGTPNQDMREYLPYLRSVARGTILEIGVRDGVSTAAFLLGVKEKGGHVYSVDVNYGCAKIWSRPEDQWTFILANSNMHSFAIRQIVPTPVDVLFIDGDHSYEGVSTDLKTFTPWVREGGLIIMHDVDPSPETIREIIENDWFPHADPRRAYDEFTSQHPTWAAHIKKGRFGLGVITKGAE